MILMKTKLINPCFFLLSVVSITLSIVLLGKIEEAKLLISISLVLFQIYYLFSVIFYLCGFMILMPQLLIEENNEYIKLEECVKNIIILIIYSFASAMLSFYVYAYFKFFIFKI